MKKYRLTAVLAFSFVSIVMTFLSHAENNSHNIEQVLALDEAPAGIVFEIVTGTTNSLRWALPQIQNQIKELRARFPNIEIAIITHGDEQFSLQTKNNKRYKDVHTLTQQLVKDANTNLHVCGTYAAMRNISEEDFPDYVDVTASGPATINDYISLGYLLIEL